MQVILIYSFISARFICSEIGKENQCEEVVSKFNFRKSVTCNPSDTQISDTKDGHVKSYVPLVAQIASRMIE